MRTLAAKYDISDVGLAKACKRADIPLPPRGYWAKQQAGWKVSKPALPGRGLGMTDEVKIGHKPWSGYHLSDKEALAMTLPPAPVFEEDIAIIRERVRKMVGKVKIPKSLDAPHPLIQQLLDADRHRREKLQQSSYSWDKPIFDSPLEQRRLKILNGIFIAMELCGMKPSLRGNEARGLYIRVGETSVAFILDSIKADKQIEREQVGHIFTPRGDHDKMCLCITSSRNFSKECKSWSDDTGKIEKHLREIVETLILSGEIYYRDYANHHHQWLIKRKTTAEENERNRILEEERKRCEHQEKLEKQRVDHLLVQANALRQAVEIRSFVDAARRMNMQAENPVSQQEFEKWAEWALAQANRIDPVFSGQFRLIIEEPEKEILPY